ncbi:MAG: dTDP-4-dehydrorhamnose reductase [Bacteroidales bacterium]
MKSILITGTSGQLGHEIQGLSYTHVYKGYKFIHTNRNTLDISWREIVENYFENNQIDCIINCAAFTNVDNAEAESELAMLVNGSAVEWLVSAATKRQTRIFHVSTDYVFDGTNCRPYKEDDQVNPVSVYGKSKLAGEKAVLDYEYGTVIRASWLYSPRGKNFFNTILKFGEERPELNVVYDQVGTPTYARDLARVLLTFADHALVDGSSYKGGLYHYSNEGVCSWYDFALEIIKQKGLHCQVNPIESEQYPTPAVRPHFSVLNKNKIKSQLSLKIPHWKDSLASCLDQLD